ncbi:MAG: endonuclease/exonuclease/phosphatase family protein, partial [Candidatus Heimdallarchaeota archaeon]
ETGSLAGQVPIIVTHFQTSGFADDRFLQAQAIFAQTISDQRAILMGDFNTPPNGTDPTYLLLNNSFSDAWVLAGNDPLIDTGRTSYNDDGTLDNRIDYIWLKGSWNVLQCDVSGRPRDSDHRAVFAELTMS